MHKGSPHQRGGILVMAVILLVILIGFAALVLDLGRLYVLRTEMQNAVDAAALAAAAELDGQVNARDDAVIAARNLLLHEGRFSDEAELLQIIKYDSTIDPLDPAANATNAIEFYSWISAENDPAPDSCTHPLLADGTEDEKKCLASGDSDAYFLKVRLHPDLVINEEEYFQISLLFFPVMSLVTGNDPTLTATTSTTAVAGAGASMICHYPPMFMCKDPGMTIGHQVRIKVQKDNWAPGNFGFLAVPAGAVVNPKTGHTLAGNQALAAALANEELMGCTPSTVETEPGNMVGWTRDGLNTRFGIYNAGLFKEGANPHAAYAAAPNVIDYPRDRDFASERYGTGWQSSIDGAPTPPMDQHYIPSTYNPLEYYQTYHVPGALELPAALGGPAGTPSRYQFYQWELTNTVTAIDEDEWLQDQSLNCDDIGDSCPEFQLDRDLVYSAHPDQPPAPANAGLPYLRLANSCDSSDPDSQDPKNRDCTLLDGMPLEQAISGPHRIPQKRILYVAELDCDAAGIPLNGKTSFDVLQYGRFIKLFLTEHIQPPSGGPDEKVDVYAEYLGPVEKTDEVYQELIHTQIQLYE